MVLGQGHTLKTTAAAKAANGTRSVYRDCRDEEAGGRWLEDRRSAKEGSLSGELTAMIQRRQGTVSITEYQSVCVTSVVHRSVSPGQLLWPLLSEASGSGRTPQLIWIVDWDTTLAHSSGSQCLLRVVQA